MKYTYTIFLIIIILAIAIILSSSYNRNAEGFRDFSNFTLHENTTSIFNKFYAGEYEDLFKSYRNINVEISNILSFTVEADQKKNLKILDLGCGTGQHLKELGKLSFNLVGVDISQDMLDIAKTNTETSKLVKGDFHNKQLFKLREFSHILCSFLTIYYSENVEKIFKNANYWLRMGGYFCIHLLGGIPKLPGKFKLSNFTYINKWLKSNENNILEENFLFNDKKTLIRNKHTLYIKPLGHYINIGKQQGFKVFKKIDLSPNDWGENYILIFKKRHGP